MSEKAFSESDLEPSLNSDEEDNEEMEEDEDENCGDDEDDGECYSCAATY